MEGTDMYLDVMFLTRVKFNRMMTLLVTCSHGMDRLMYFIISKGNIIDVGFFRPNQRTRYTFQILVSKKLIPESMLYLIASANGRVKLSRIRVMVNEFGNPIEIKIEENISEDGIDPGDEFELSIRGRPGAFIALIAYDRRFMQYMAQRRRISYHDIYHSDVWLMFSKFHPYNFDITAALGAPAEFFDSLETNSREGEFKY
ncbi:uncharacterized protein LOC126576632 [Anopheles aquasalis]|uniref:uncharacterized protein LOC126576632 n=1 Tax=Anopheles aquasalis TaxID=42839 RepID=UPI00215A25F7|nr:uncharacterized protein LOC126576632 [Anopheles aquasalis]